MTDFEKYFVSKDYGGYSTCIHDGSLKNPWYKGSVLSNCVGLVWGMLNLVYGTRSNFVRISGNANQIYPKARPEGSGWLTDPNPKTFGIACYNIGDCGHVVFLLHVWSDGQAIGIESNYSGNMSNGLALRVKYGNPKKWYKNYQGCVRGLTKWFK